MQKASFWLRGLIVVAINAVPMFVLDFSPWIIGIISLLLCLFDWAQIPYFGIWIWAAVVTVQQPFSWFTVLFFVLMLACLASTIGTVILIGNKRRY